MISLLIFLLLFEFNYSKLPDLRHPSLETVFELMAEKAPVLTVVEGNRKNIVLKFKSFFLSQQR